MDNELQKIQRGYSRISGFYEFYNKLLYKMFGIGDTLQFRQNAIDSLELKKGEIVIDLACGAGINFSPLEEIVGIEGKIVGVDITKKMLDLAKKKIKENNWKNIELIQCDAAQYTHPEQVDGIVCTFSMYSIPDYKSAIQCCAENLKSGRNLSIFDVKLMKGFMKIANPILFFVTRNIGGSYEKLGRKPWKEMEKYFDNIHITEDFFGLLYYAVGTKK